jgi:hypothetical protein
MEFNEKTKNCTQTSAFHEPTTKKSNIQKTNVTQQIFTFKIKEKLGNISPTKKFSLISVNDRLPSKLQFSLMAWMLG